ncbi:hypothetical protein SDC9_180749 [bioreactor metagenome]|uniref:Uncharacterized protein n=1 Tax=bioreactor metagenome TaxID=1076179 RepID=A0A645HAY0_9ZZZZ
MHQRDTSAMVLQRIGDGTADKTLATLHRNGLYPHRTGIGKANLLHTHLFFQKGYDTLHFIASRFPLDAGIDILGILPEDNHIDLFRMLDRRRHPRIVLHRPKTDVQIQCLAKCHVQRTNALTHRSGQGTFDRHLVGVDGFNGLVWEVRSHPILRLLPCEHFLPQNSPLA